MIAVDPALAHTRKLYGLALRMTGCAADAEDVVQETWLRYVASPPREHADVEPWLVTVTLNLARDKLRKRKREGYRGPWLPTPIDPDVLGPEPVSPDASIEARYSQLESVSYAFLLALEALTPMQRAVLLLRDVLDASAKDTALAVGSTEAAVKVTLHRARKKLEGYERGRTAVDRAAGSASAPMVLVQFLEALRAGDVEGMKAVLATDAVALTDGGGVFHAAVVPLHGPDRIVSVLLSIQRKAPPLLHVELAMLGGLPFAVGEQDSQNPKIARRFAVGCDLDASGKIKALYTVVAPRKLPKENPNLVPPAATSFVMSGVDSNGPLG